MHRAGTRMSLLSPVGFLEDEFVRKSQLLGEVCPHARVLGPREGHHDARRALRGGEVIAIDVEFVLLGFAAEDRRQIKHQHAAGRAGLVIGISGRETCDAAADDHNVVALARIVGAGNAAVALMIANGAMRCIDDFGGIAVRLGIVADASRSGPFRAQARHGQPGSLGFRTANRMPEIPSLTAHCRCPATPRRRNHGA